jgi:hypothetical protein
VLWLLMVGRVSSYFFLSGNQKCGLQPSKCWWSGKGTWQWLAETPRAKVLWLSSMVGLQSDATAGRYRQTHRAKKQGTSHMHLRHTHTDKLVICTLSRHACTVYLLLVSCSLLVQDLSTVAMAPSFSLSLAMPAGAAISPAASAIVAYRNVAGSSSTVSSQLGRFSSSEIFAVKLVAAPSRRLCCSSVLDDSSARGRVAVCKVCFLDLTKAYYVDRRRRCDLVLLWSTVCRLSFDLWWLTRFFYRRVSAWKAYWRWNAYYSCLWWFLDLIESAFLDGTLMLRISVPRRLHLVWSLHSHPLSRWNSYGKIEGLTYSVVFILQHTNLRGRS